MPESMKGHGGSSLESSWHLVSPRSQQNPGHQGYRLFAGSFRQSNTDGVQNLMHLSKNPTTDGVGSLDIHFH